MKYDGDTLQENTFVKPKPKSQAQDECSNTRSQQILILTLASNKMQWTICLLYN